MAANLECSLKASGRAKGGGGVCLAALYRGGNFELQIYFYYTNRGAAIYLAPGGNTLGSATA